MARRLDIARIIRDLGGATEVSRRLDIPRSAPYRWLERGSLKVSVLDRLLTEWPELRLDDYVREDWDGIETYHADLAGRSTARGSVRSCVRISR